MQNSQELALVYSAIARINEMRLPEEQIPSTPDSILVGDEGLLDSLALTTFILALEDSVRAGTGRDVSLLQYSESDDWLEIFHTPETVAALLAEKLR